MPDFLRTLRRSLLPAAAGALWLAPQAAMACPGCKDSLNAHYAAAYGASIVFMLSMPFLIVGGLSAYFYWEVRRARKKQAAAAAGASAAEPAESLKC